MSFSDDIGKKVLVFDGSMGVVLQGKGLEIGACAEEWNITHPEAVRGNICFIPGCRGRCHTVEHISGQ